MRSDVGGVLTGDIDLDERIAAGVGCALVGARPGADVRLSSGCGCGRASGYTEGVRAVAVISAAWNAGDAGGSQQLCWRGQHGSGDGVKEVIPELKRDCIVERFRTLQAACWFEAQVPHKQSSVGRSVVAEHVEVLLVGDVANDVSRVSVDERFSLDPVAAGSSRNGGGDRVRDNRWELVGFNLSSNGEWGSVAEAVDEGAGMDRAVRTLVFCVGVTHKFTTIETGDR